jgi:hypothetical protein
MPEFQSTQAPAGKQKRPPVATGSLALDYNQMITSNLNIFF